MQANKPQLTGRNEYALHYSDYSGRYVGRMLVNADTSADVCQAFELENSGRYVADWAQLIGRAIPDRFQLN